VGRIYSIPHCCTYPGIKVLSRDTTLGVYEISTEILNNRIHPLIMLGLFLTEGMDGTVQNFATFTCEFPNATQRRISSEIGITAIIIQHGLDTGQPGRINFHSGDPPTFGRFMNICREGIVLCPLVGMGKVQIKLRWEFIDDCHGR
jgi:hypothetical protein